MAVDSRERLVAVVGASGFLGRYVVQELCRQGVRVRAVCRNTQAALFLKPLGGLGQVQIAGADITRASSLAPALDGADVVVNLVGVLSGNFKRVHVEGAAAVADAAREAGAETFVHISAIGADPASPSAYGRSKAEGEERVRAVFPHAIIIRPSILFGAEDDFINRFARIVKLFPAVPVIRPDVRFQPIWVGDVAQAVATAACQPKAYAGKTFELGGPRIYSFRDLIAWIADTLKCRRSIVPVPDFVAEKIAVLGFLPGAPITRDQWLMLQKDNVVAEGAKGIKAFDIQPTPLEAAAPAWLVRHRPHGRFNISSRSEVR